MRKIGEDWPCSYWHSPQCLCNGTASVCNPAAAAAGLLLCARPAGGMEMSTACIVLQELHTKHPAFSAQ